MTAIDDGGRNGAAASLKTRRYMRPGEVGGRVFIRAIYRWIGGVHPFIGWQIVLLPIWVRGDAYVLALMPMMTVASILMLYHSARSAGCSRLEAMEVLQGKRFIDGEPLELDERADEIAIAAGGQPMPERFRMP